MSKFTKRIKKYKKNKSIKNGGSPYPIENDDPREGVVDMVTNKIGDVASAAASKISDVGLKIMGLERINHPEIHNENTVVSDIGNTIDKTGAAIVENVNEVLGSDAIKETTQQAAQHTAEIVKESAETFNQALNQPEVKAEVKEALKNAGEIASVIIEEGKEPFNKAVDVAAEAAQKATGAAVSGAIKVGTDALGAVPYLGAIVDMGKILNDGSKAASSVVEAGSEATEAVSDAFIETKEKVENGLKELEEKKKMADQITGRTINSIKQFENVPTNSQIAGKRRTRRRLTKYRAKSKRVRFAI
jgi:uncharacterized protein Yka (UPF0111/DUF47 family)